MGKKKLNLIYISNDAKRRTTFNKRKKGLLKKLKEISILCDVEACAMIQNPYTKTEEIWPSDSEMKTIVEKFETFSDKNSRKKMVSHQEFLQESVLKLEKQNRNMAKEVNDLSMKLCMFRCLDGTENPKNLNDDDREGFIKYVRKYIEALSIRKQFLLDERSAAAAAVNIGPSSEVNFEIPDLNLNPKEEETVVVKIEKADE